MPGPQRPAFLRYGSAVLATILATLVRLWLDPVLENQAPFSMYFVAIMFAAWYGGLSPALVAIVSGALLADYFFVEPRGSLLITDPTINDLEHQIGLGLYVFVGIVVALLSESLHASRRRAEAANVKLKTSEEKFRTVADFTYDWEYWEGPDGEMVWISPSCKRITGYAAEEFMADRNLLETIAHPEDREFVRNHRQEARDSREPLRLEFRIVTRNGEVRYIEHACQPVYGEHGRYLGRRVNNRDATERKRAEAAVRLAQEQLLQYQQRQREEVEAELAKVKDQLIRQTRLAAIGQVSASIAHDLRNPLAAVRNAAFLLKRRLPDDQPKCLEYVELIDQEIDVTNRIINNLMEMAHGKQPQKERIDLGEAIREVFGRLEHGTIDLQMQLDFQPFVVAADPVQFRQVLGNLMSNTIQAMPNGGEIRIHASHQGNRDTIFLEDDGPGIPEELRGQVFEPLVTTKPKGTGLGLAICRQIIERHGGTIELMATSRPGAAFEIDLPSPDATGAS